MDERDTIKFQTTGKEIYANLGIVGISPDLEIHYGYDGDIMYDFGPNDYVKENGLSHVEAIELGIMMVERWTQFILRAAEAEAKNAEHI